MLTKEEKEALKKARASEKKALKGASKMKQQITALIDALWKDYDEDQSGQLEYKEVRKMMAELYKQMDQKAINDVEFDILFKKIDKDGSGQLDRAEAVMFMLEMM
jgi:Ca2+-binding EF-hand superfamily protein